MSVLETWPQWALVSLLLAMGLTLTSVLYGAFYMLTFRQDKQQRAAMTAGVLACVACSLWAFLIFALILQVATGVTP